MSSHAGHPARHITIVGPNVQKVIDDEIAAKLDRIEGYESFARQVRETKLELVDFLLSAARQGKKVAGYGAPGKSATLLHYCGIGKDLISYTVDRSPYKQGRHLPGSRIPIFRPIVFGRRSRITLSSCHGISRKRSWRNCSYIREWGGRFVIPIPKVTIS